jgi:hypothetical protein
MATENRLARETSPYLLQHARNPVDWYAWGPEALQRAKAENKPILLSIGYAACHWCHVMERESFENPDIARLMNEFYVCIKVDREERPDLDEIYMNATVAMSGSGGWPMTVFLTPDQQPFFAGTYYPPADRYGRPGFPTLLCKIAALWANEREALFGQAQELTRHLSELARVGPPGELRVELMGDATLHLTQTYDARWGGFGTAPKFPPSQSLELLMREHYRSGSEQALRMLKGTLDGMRRGGMYDHVGGGFARYSTDAQWHVPHFEKMLYDNAQLARVYAQAYQLTGNPDYARVTTETLDYVAREMQGAEGGYFSATDADSEGEEGKYFVWMPDEVEEVTGQPDAERFCAFYDITPQGNWEGNNVLRITRDKADVAGELGISIEELEVSLERARAALYARRLTRVPPLLDDKVLVAWNGLMIDAMAVAARIFPGRGYLESATRAANFTLSTLTRPDRGLLRTYRAGKAHLAGYLEDYAYLVQGLISLYEASGDEAFLRRALELGERMLRDFGSDEGPLYQTAHDHEALIARVREGHDGALPSPNAIAALGLSRLARHFGREDLAERARALLASYASAMRRMPRAYAGALCALHFMSEPPLELVLAGEPSSADHAALANVLGRVYLPNRIEARLAAGQDSELPLAQGKGLVSGRAALYVCQNFTCAAPITEPEAALAALGIKASSVPGAR